ncbi:MAG: transcription factor S [Thermoplasmata archaeon]|jgi:DNA-directed RNA polymerase subunit M|nr:transcription factor S [Thermoplasmata archaeon]MCI4341715.1 transcription factor S [Thermoplasmata archaeon]
MFCPKCKRLMRPDRAANAWVCPGCATRVKMGASREVGKTPPTGRGMETIEEGRQPTLPTADETCPKCGNAKAYWVLRQTRGADEPETRIFECTSCGHKWREYQ